MLSDRADLDGKRRAADESEPDDAASDRPETRSGPVKTDVEPSECEPAHVPATNDAAEGAADEARSGSDSETPSAAGPGAEESSSSADTGEPNSGVDTRTPKGRFRRSLSALRRPPVLATTLVILLLAAGLAYTATQLWQRAAQDSARASAIASAREYALALTTYDHRNLEGNFRTVTDNSSPGFARQYKQVSDGLTQLIQQYQATSRGNVLNQGVVEAGEDRAVLVLFVDQSITNTNNLQPRVDRTRMQMTLTRPDDRWLIEDVRLV